jgi:DNA-directed RNA polymerase subunit M/transcription elongation factor TFIIS
MASRTMFVRSCPTCGRTLEIRVELLGRKVECVHCGAGFTANQSSDASQQELRIDRVLERAKQYIDSVAPANSAVDKS